jgi:oxygen-independent coproporphyrinogen-3 oxidase
MDSYNSPLSVYLHIPFCATKCTYCAFNTYVQLEALIEPFVGALVREIEIVGQSKPNQAVHTIFFGGGTPSLLTPDQFARILDALRAAFHVLPDAEITLETNPNDLERDYAASLRRIGFNRISIGMQSANENELRLFRRRHDNDAVVRAVSAARAGGFGSLNLDLIYGAPHQTLASWENTLRQTVALQPDHVSLYALGLEEGTPMARWVESGKLPTPDDDLAADMYLLASDTLGAAGYAQYEISNWSRPGFECRHNLQYWRNLAYIGLGPGAHGYADGVRYSVLISPQRYIKALGEAKGMYRYPHTPATDQAVEIDRDGEIAETLIMGLRLTQEGIERETFRQRFGADLLDIHPAEIEKYEALGLLHVDDVRVRLTERGRLLSNVVFRELV